MGLNIKDPEAHRLAKAISEATGESMTHVVRQALRERLAEIEARRSRASVAELVEISRCAFAQLKRPYVDHNDLLYAEGGSPK